MKRVLSIVCVAVLLFSVLCLAGCGMDGTYKITKIYAAGVEIKPASLGYGDAQLEIRGNKANLTGIEGSSGTLTIDTKEKTMSGGSTVIPYEEEENKVTLNMSSMGMEYKLVFEKQG